MTKLIKRLQGNGRMASQIRKKLYKEGGAGMLDPYWWKLRRLMSSIKVGWGYILRQAFHLPASCFWYCCVTGSRWWQLVGSQLHWQQQAAAALLELTFQNEVSCFVCVTLTSWTPIASTSSRVQLTLACTYDSSNYFVASHMLYCN